LLILALVSK